MAMAIAYRAGSNLKGLSLTDWDVLRIDRHAKKVIVTVVVAYLTFPFVGVYLALLAPRRPALVGSATKKSDNLEWRKISSARRAAARQRFIHRGSGAASCW